MKSRWMAVLGVAMFVGWPMAADTIMLQSGSRVEGVITKLEKGKVFIETSAGPQEVDLTEVASVNFDTPHVVTGTAKLPAEHFLKDFDPQEMGRLGDEVKRMKAETRKQLGQIKTTWGARQPIDKDAMAKWSAAKESFSVPFSRYREAVQDMYFHVLNQIDEYNKVAHEAEQVYIGVKGPFNVGSPLVTAETGERTVKESVPKSWYDRIYFDGYNKGYKEGAEFERLTRIPASPSSCDPSR
ncbi:MAG: hypothetical protein ABL995_19015 [Bryobacteraceae bacterium]